jgi:hypothetical protein
MPAQRSAFSIIRACVGRHYRPARCRDRSTTGLARCASRRARLVETATVIAEDSR